jgi:hypothetical protein
VLFTTYKVFISLSNILSCRSKIVWFSFYYSVKVRKVLTAPSAYRIEIDLGRGISSPSVRQSVRIDIRYTGVGLDYLLNKAVVFRVILYDFVQRVRGKLPYSVL